MMNQLSEAGILFTQDLAGSTSTTPYPSGATAGVPVPGNPGRDGTRVHVAVDYTVASGTMSLTVPVYGYTWPSNTLPNPIWVYLGALNGGTSITNNTSSSAQSATRITLAEVFSMSGENYQRYATRSIPGGTSPVVSTYIGFCKR